MRFLDLVNYWIVDEYIVDERHEKHQARRNELNQRYIGELSAAPEALPVEKPKHGIPRPSWFREITTVGDVHEVAASLQRR